MKERYGELAKQILLGVALVGVVIVVAAAPGVVLAAKLFEYQLKQSPKNYERQKARRALQRLEKNRLLKIKEKNGTFIIELTKEGKRMVQQIQLENLQISKSPRWDKKWRIVIFDIPEEALRAAREILRAKLKEWEFYPLQKSVWVSPWPCEKEMHIVAQAYGITRYVNVVVAEKIVNDAVLRKHYGLSS